ncbi:MAG: hypothetical protein ABIP97_00705, partial [Chthoniobacterales bacterium]
MNRFTNTVKLFLAPLWKLPLSIIRYRGHAVDCAVNAYRNISEASFLHLARINFKEANPFKHFPGLLNQPVRLSECHWGSTHDRAEYPLLMGICGTLQPKNIFEFGTFLGEATRMFA